MFILQLIVNQYVNKHGKLTLVAMRHFFQKETFLNCQSLAIHAIIEIGLISPFLPFGQADQKGPGFGGGRLYHQLQSLEGADA